MMAAPKVLFQNKVEHLNPASLTPALYNPRPSLKQKNPERFRRLQRSMQQGIFKPILVNKRTGHIVAGHQRVEAAIELGLVTVPVLFLDVDEKDEKRINIADNVEWSEFDRDLLQQVLSEEDFGDDIELFGFDDDVLAEINQELGTSLTDDDEVELPEQKGLETLRLIFTTDQLRRVMECIESVKAQVKGLKSTENPNENGTAAYYIFEHFRRTANVNITATIDERTHPAFRKADAVPDADQTGETDS